MFRDILLSCYPITLSHHSGRHTQNADIQIDVKPVYQNVHYVSQENIPTNCFIIFTARGQ